MLYLVLTSKIINNKKLQINTFFLFMNQMKEKN